MHELDSQFSGTTLFNTVVVIGPDGKLLNRHRKLIPTNPERMVWGRGDASGLRVVDTPAGRIGTLICWENYMPLARYALYAQNLEVLVAPTWDCGDEWIASLRHIAREGGCWVIGTGTAIQARDVPDNFPGARKALPRRGRMDLRRRCGDRPPGRQAARRPAPPREGRAHRRDRPRGRPPRPPLARRHRPLRAARPLPAHRQPEPDAAGRFRRRVAVVALGQYSRNTPPPQHAIGVLSSFLPHKLRYWTTLLPWQLAVMRPPSTGSPP